MLATLSAQTFHRMHAFDITDGQNPGGLVQGADGNLWGTTEFGGTAGYGTIFQITIRGKLTTIYSFCFQTLCADGSYPVGALIQSSDGNFYGATNAGGAAGYGSIFRLKPAGVLTTLYSFCAQRYPVCPDGYGPFAGLVRARNGNFYGTTENGGANNYGTVFSITASGTLTTLHSFNNTDGAFPVAPLVEASDGNLYGTTSDGSGAGTIFRITPDGTLENLYTFCSLSGCADGEDPVAGLIEGSDGYLYGTTNGRTSGYGTVFKITLDGTLTTLHSFCSLGCRDGAYPNSPVIQASDGNFYGTTSGYGARGGGTVFEITSHGTLTTLYFFCQTKGCQDGDGPDALIQATNGTFYGLTRTGGQFDACGGFGCGSVFSFATGLQPSSQR
jgi:uncharacterized repeat protein (TIGR03803 family)